MKSVTSQNRPHCARAPAQSATSPFNMSTLLDEKREVERGLYTSCFPGSKWEPIAIEWFLKWNLYVDSDDDSLYPGPVDNSSLKGKYEDELRPGLADKDGIFLLPCSVTNNLFKKYRGGPRFIRDVINSGSTILPNYQVNLYRVRVDAYLCDTENPHPDMTNLQRRIVRFFVNKAPFKEVVDSLIKGIGLSTCATALRCDGSIVPGTTDGSTNAEISGDSKRRRIHATEMTRMDGVSTYLCRNSLQSIQEIRGDDERVHLFIGADRSRKLENCEWPRVMLLKKLKIALRVGDLVDCKDMGPGKWYNAVVKEVNARGDVSVHYKGWGARFDEVIPSHLVNQNIQPLYMHTMDRREWAVGDEVDFRVSPADCRAVWVPAKIVALNKATDHVLVEYPYEVKIYAFEKYNLPVPGQSTSSVAGALGVDMAKRQLNAVYSLNDLSSHIDAGSSLTYSVNSSLKGENIDNISTDMNSRSTWPLSPPVDGLCREWCDRLGEDICPVLTHTRNYKPPISFPHCFTGQANYLGTSSALALTTTIRPEKDINDVNEEGETAPNVAENSEVRAIIGEYHKCKCVLEQPETYQATGRPGQAKFRDGVLKEFNNKCVVTGCDCVDVLEAAHIVPYAESCETDVKESPKNGVLMRADVHKLFDSDLLRVLVKDGCFCWWLDGRVTYLDEIQGKPCDAVFRNDPDRHRFLEQSGRIIR